MEEESRGWSLCIITLALLLLAWDLKSLFRRTIEETLGVAKLLMDIIQNRNALFPLFFTIAEQLLLIDSRKEFFPLPRRI